MLITPHERKVGAVKSNPEYAYRAAGICAGCGHEKQVGLVVCWHCFKRHAIPFKYFNGGISAWLRKIGRPEVSP